MAGLPYRASRPRALRRGHAQASAQVKIRFLSVARQELDDAVELHEHQSAGLGRRFLVELDRAVHRVKAYPNSCTELTPGLRRALLGRFPHGLVYGQAPDANVIVAVAHLHRRPRYWIGRLTDDRPGQTGSGSDSVARDRPRRRTHR